MNHKHIVLITSAMYSNYGIFTPAQRIEQTLATAKSVRTYIPESIIILIDNSKVDIQSDTSDSFNTLLDTVDYYIDNSDDVDIKHFHENVSNYDVGKNAMECLGIVKALTYISTDAELMELITTSSRIFKISGRYELTNKFNINNFDNEQTKNKYVFKVRQPSWIPIQDTGVDTLLQTRFWSFTPALFLDTIGLFNAIIRNMFDLFNKQKYIDVEHSMAKFIPTDKLVEIETIGLIGKIAPNGMVVVD